MDYQLFYKFMTNYRSIIRVSKIDICYLLKNAAGNVFFSKPILALRTAFPNAEFNCPFKVQTLKYLLVSYWTFFQELILYNATIGTMATIQSFPAGHYRNVYAFTNNEGFMFKVVAFINNFSKDITGF